MINDVMYAINDVLTRLANDLGVTFADDEEQDDILNELTHSVAAAFKVGAR